jgi:hypothetical protein
MISQAQCYECPNCRTRAFGESRLDGLIAPRSRDADSPLDELVRCTRCELVFLGDRHTIVEHIAPLCRPTHGDVDRALAHGAFSADAELNLRLAAWRQRSRALQSAIAADVVAIATYSFVTGALLALAELLVELGAYPLAAWELFIGVLFAAVTYRVLRTTIASIRKRETARRGVFDARSLTAAYRSANEESDRGNLARLGQLLGDGDRVLRAEIARQLGRFEEAIVLAEPAANEHARRIVREARRQNPFAVRLR